MIITPIEFEQGRFEVQSRSRADVTHTVDLRELGEWRKPRATCTCEAFIAHPVTCGQPCPHILAVVAAERERLGV